MLKLWNFLKLKNSFKLIGLRVVLRPVLKRDFKIINQFFKDQEIIELAFGVKYEKNFLKNITSDYLQNLLLCLNKTFVIEVNKKIIGFTTYTYEASQSCHIRLGITIGDKKYWNQGYGTEALKVFLNYLFNKIKVNKIMLDTALFNQRAQRCFEKCGFKKIKKDSETNFNPTFSKIWMCLNKEDFKNEAAG